MVLLKNRFYELLLVVVLLTHLICLHVQGSELSNFDKSEETLNTKTVSFVSNYLTILYNRKKIF